MFNQVTINTTRYSQLLVDLESGNSNNSVQFDGGNSKYNATGEVARDLLTGVGRTWTITDGGQVPFTLEVKTDEAGTSNNDQFTIPTTTGTYLYDYTTSDGQSGTGLTGGTTITFASGAGTYTISITGVFPRIYFNSGGDKQKLLRVLEWGDYGFGALDQTLAFRGCTKLTSVADDTDNLNLITNAQRMFMEATSLFSLPT
ncbi:unnamed protein product, partial [marine sediment metagenome]